MPIVLPITPTTARMAMATKATPTKARPRPATTTDDIVVVVGTSSVESLVCDLDLNRDHESSLHPPSITTNMSFFRNSSRASSDPSPPSSSQLKNHTEIPSHDHEDHP
ncbi:Vacuolar protein sorting-associated protein 5 [Puccinia graminis f. sp. tritici]|uniref:Vacuolar protein sorting-associated protein 5 n=1 Tax=Puccinia graminis f. sp. tritici TaxID=56615 RepID=A0A5B0MCN7_PUCGR|nr:Vacuolar protein sorting-associated protein 5 [Puccinia graminis f. sp. tritici]